jgi:hypothetical protein
MELTELDTFRMLEDLLIASIQYFEFPRIDITSYELSSISGEEEYCGIESNDVLVKAIIYDGGYFNNTLTAEEINILSTYMVVEWMGQQLASVENTRMKYSGSSLVLFIRNIKENFRKNWNPEMGIRAEVLV